MAGLLGEYAKGLLGFVSDPQSWKDMGRNAVGLLGAPLPTQQEAQANLQRLRMRGSVMRDYPGPETDLAKSYREKMTNVALGMNPVLMMAGPKAKTANLAALEQAQKLEQSGAPREAIWNQTGWFKGPEGKWKFEIDDSAARFNATMRNGRMVEDDISRGQPGQDYGPTVGGLLRHDLLQSAYPEPLAKRTFLGNKNTMFGDGVQGAYDNGALTINAPVKAQDGRSTALHELQHAIQEREGFAIGGTPDAMYSSMGTIRGNTLIPEAQAIFNAAQKSGANPSQSGAAMEAYRRLAGEAEARAVQTRMNMTPAQRQATPPWQSYDVPWDQLIVK